MLLLLINKWSRIDPRESSVWHSQTHLYGRTLAAIVLYWFGFEIMLCSLYLCIPNVIDSVLWASHIGWRGARWRFWGKVRKQDFQGTGCFPGTFLGFRSKSWVPPFFSNSHPRKQFVLFPSLQNVTQELVIHSVQKEIDSKISPSSLVKKHTAGPIEVF